MKWGDRRIPLPASRIARTAVGAGLIMGGVLGFLPVVGFWMIPLGVMVLSYDFPWARRARRRVAVWWQRRFQNGRGGNGQPSRNGGEGPPP